MTINSRSQTTVEGLDELIKAFMDLPQESVVYVRNASNEAGNKVLLKAKEKAPVLTGRLREKIKLQRAGKSAKYPYRITSKVTFTKDIAHAVPVELGHKLVRNGRVVGKVTERPFLRPAADESKGDVVSAVAESMNKAIAQMGGRR